jgi:coenzyme F420-0:L-glutamate ligase/coenzyme F420-1:gamma-L-glutamate ligase
MSQLKVQAKDLIELIRTRRSIRHYQDTNVPRDAIEQILDAAHWAPSSHNRQPWRFAVIESAETKRALASAMGQRLRADLERDGAPQHLIDTDTARSYQRITRAPIVIVACLTMRDMDKYPDARRNQAEYLMATQSVAMAVQNLLLAAHASGLGACWMCAPLFVPDTVREILGLENDSEPQALITLGYPAEEKMKTRNSVESIVGYLDTDKHG